MQDNLDSPEAEARLRLRQASLLDLSEREFLQWRHHPVSKVVLAFLADRQKQLISAAVEGWLQSGKLVDEKALEARGRVLELVDLVGLDWPSLEAFYGIEHPEQQEKESDDGA
jgi:hypothetical protein